ncbi:hypothetical protein G3N64_01280 [Burkholderia sp. Ac-20344]|nr:hypothetical protein [Burkholderia sp. Ac-20344]
MQHRCIRYRFESGALYRWDLIRKGKRVSVDVDGPMTLGNPGLMIDAALAGSGIACVTESRVADLVATRRLVRALPAWSQDFGAPCLYYPPAALRLFVEAVREGLAAGRDAAPA